MALAAARSFSSPLTTPNATEFAYDSLKEAFPDVDPGLKPFGTVGLFQIRQPKMVSKGGILLPADSQSTEHYNTQVAKVIALGPLCFKSRGEDGLVEWEEGPWFKIGDYVRVPRYGGDRFTVAFERKDMVGQPGRQESVTTKVEAVFSLFKVSNVLGLLDVTNALTLKAYID